MKNKIIIIALAIFLLGAGLYFLLLSNPNYFKKSSEPRQKEVSSELEAECFENDDYFVIEQKDPGHQTQESHIIVKSKEYPAQEIPCEFLRGKDDFLIDNFSGIGSVLEIFDNYLFVNYGATKIFGLSIFDLSKREKIHQDISDGIVEISSKKDGVAIQYWRVVGEINASQENCPEYNQFIEDNWEVGFNQLIILNLTDLTEELGELVCVNRE